MSAGLELAGTATYAALVLVGALLSLDRTAFLQSMVSRPLPVSFIAGLVLGDAQMAMGCGVILELIWLAKIPVGGMVPPDDTTAALVACAVALAAPGDWSAASAVGLGVVTAMPFAHLGRIFDMLARRRNAALVEGALAALEGGSTRLLGRTPYMGVCNFFTAGLASSAISLALGLWLADAAVGYLPEALRRGMELMSVALPAIGAGAFIASLPGRGKRGAFILGAVVSAWLAFNSTGALAILLGRFGGGS